MPHAATHILVALIVADFIKDHIMKDRKKFPLHYVLVAGIAGLLPDIDVIVFWFLQIFSFSLNEIHRTFSHTIFFPLAFLALAYIFTNYHKRRLFFLMVALGSFIHLILDFTIMGVIRPIYPLSSFAIGLELFKGVWAGTLIPGIDAILLVLWLVHEEKQHKISDFF